MSPYPVEIEICEGGGGQLHKEGVCAWMYRGDGHSHQAGQRFKYPEDSGKICLWLCASMDGFIKALRYGGTLPMDLLLAQPGVDANRVASVGHDFGAMYGVA